MLKPDPFINYTCFPAADERSISTTEVSEVQQLISDIPVECSDTDSGTSKELKVMLQHEC